MVVLFETTIFLYLCGRGRCEGFEKRSWLLLLFCCKMKKERKKKVGQVAHLWTLPPLIESISLAE